MSPVSFQKPAVTVDNRQVMHVLYLVSPTMWNHARISPDGTLLGALGASGGTGDQDESACKTAVSQAGFSISG